MCSDRAMVRIFRCYDVAQDVLDCALAAGIVGISGGRTSTRRLLRAVHDLAEAGGHEQIMALSTYDHPDTELAYIYDNELYDSDSARAKVIKAYDLANPSEY